MIETIDLGVSAYEEAYKLQRDLVRRRQAGIIADTLIATEHLPVFTIGRRGSRENLLVDDRYLAEKSIRLIETDRGGDITFHGPGQLVLYPIIDIARLGRDIHLFIRRLEEVIIDFLGRYDIAGFRVKGASGVWVGKDAKIGSIGIGISKWVSYHGLSVNIDTPPDYFGMIRSCGLSGCRMVSISSLLKRDVDGSEAKRGLVESFKNRFDKWREEKKWQR